MKKTYKKKLISIATSCYNESISIDKLCQHIDEIFKASKKYNYEIVISDNDSTDRTPEVLYTIARKNKNVKVLFNQTNYGHVRSPYSSLMHCSGDVIIRMASDLEDPPELIPKFIKYWENGSKVVIAIRNKSAEPGLMKYVRSLFYSFISKISDTKQIKNFTGFGLYDKKVIDEVKKLNDPFPYFRGIIPELGFKIDKVFFDKPYRKYGESKGNFFTNYELAITGIVRFSKLPLRFMILLGFFLGCISMIFLSWFLYQKLINWDTYVAGMTPLLLLNLFFFSIIFIFLGIVGEYIILLISHIVRKPPVIVKEKLNFTDFKNNE